MNGKSSINNEYTFWQVLASMALVGVITTIGQLLASKELLTPRIIIGRALSSIGLSISAGAIVLWFADPHPIALIGVSAGVASLGTSFIEKVIQKKLGIKP